MTFAVGELAGATGRCGSAQAANQIAGGFVRTLPEVPTTADFNSLPLFQTIDVRPKVRNRGLRTFVRTAMVWKSGSEMNLTCPPSRYTCERDCWLCRVPSRAFSSCADLEILTYRHISAIYRALQKVAVTREAFEESDTCQ